MTSRDPAFRCAAASIERDEPLTGTASNVRAFLLVEHPGPWGVNALRDARLPDGLGAALGQRAAEARVRPLLVRRPGRDDGSEVRRMFAVSARPDDPWIESTVLTDPRQLLDLDLPALGDGRSLGLTRVEHPLFCVCTHGRHDACCAELGRPVAAALATKHPEETWEVSHIGGDRFAANLLVLPEGLYYGRLDAESCLQVAEGHAAGHVDLAHLRGRSAYAMPVQFAELALRRQHAETRLDAVRVLSRRRIDEVTHVTLEAAGAHWTVQVRTAPSADVQQLTCQAVRDNAAQEHELIDISETPQT